MADFLLNEDKEGASRYVTQIPVDDVDNFASSGFKFEWLKFYDTGSEMTIYHRNKKYVPSSHYSIAYSIKFDRDYIEFNLSIPKYLYGNNIAQFVRSPENKNFFRAKHNDLEQSKKELYNRIINFTKYFFNSEFGDMKFDYKKIEVNRIDFCFNQFFNSKHDALDFMDMQKRIPKKYARDTGNKFQNYATTLSYVSKAFSFKVYHKGAEYYKNDAKRHKQLNSELNLKGKKEMFDIPFLQTTADRILRYEATFRAKYMSRLYAQTTFRAHSKDYQKLREQYNRYHSKTKSGSEFVKADKNGVMQQVLNKEQLAFYKKFKAGLQKVNTFFIEVDYQIREHEAVYSFDFPDKYNEAKFSKELVEAMFDKFHEMSNEFQVKEMPTLEKVLRKINNSNKETIEKKERWGDMKGLLDSKELEELYPKKQQTSKIVMLMKLLEHHSLDDIKKMGIMPRSTFYRYKAQLKKLGVMDNNVNGYSQIPTSFDFEEYYNVCFNKIEGIYSNLVTKSFA